MSSKTSSSLKALLPILAVLIPILLDRVFSWISDQFFKKLGQAIGYKTLLTLILLLLASLAALWIHFRTQVDSKPQAPSNKRPDKETNEIRERMLNNLSKEEKEFLKTYLDKDSKTQYRHFQDGVSAGLAVKGVLFSPTTMMYDNKIAYNIHEWAWEHLKKHPHLLK